MKDERQRFSCVVIGEGSLPIQCAEILLARKHEIRGLFTDDPGLARWAEEAGVPCVSPGKDIHGAFDQLEFDVLFSIVNPTELPAAILARPRKYAINYHDGPLPKYAGVNATTWAIIEEQSEHGITWHLMAERVDAGDILQQASVPIECDDTSFTLNLKCYEAAVRSFVLLVDELERDALRPRPQDLGQRTYYPRGKRLPGDGVISWRSRAKEIEALVHALDFGPHPNPLGKAKFRVGDQLFLVTTLQATGWPSPVPPGTITAIDRGTLSVATSDFEVLLTGIRTLEGEPVPVRDLAERLLLKAERRQPCAEWNNTETAYPRDRCFHELFEEQAARTPEVVAVVFDDRRMTYRELNRRANQLAHYLRSLGVGPETLVAVYLERSPEMIVGLLGIAKAGGAYVPLEVECPEERLRWMLEDARPAVVLTQQWLRERLPERHPNAVCLDRAWEVIARESDQKPISGAGPENLAYVMYTSGSTGTPKGVAVPHRGIVRLLFGIDYVDLGPSERILQLAPVSFDLSTFEIWGPLLHGGQCVLCPAGIPTTDLLGRVLREYRITTMWLTSSLFNAVMDEAPEILSRLRQLLIGGEALSVSHVKRACELLPSTELINGYGPTESTTFACCYRIPKDLDETVRSVPIGRPIANTRVYLLDQRLEPVPIGVTGELYIGGDGLARGYLNRPELTAERFMFLPGGVDKGARIYRTGDLARYLPDGNIEFLGRVDNQVKIRGCRVELEEVEAVLTQHPDVRTAAVAAREDRPGDRRLVAYIVTNPRPAPTGAELRRFLKRKLPDYMVPSAFVVLGALPLTASGKVNRRALPPPAPSKPGQDANFVTSPSGIEGIVAGIWAEMLGRERVGVHEDFLDLGGHSLIATKIVSRIGKVFGVTIPLVSIFRFPTVAQLSQELTALTSSRTWSVPQQEL